MKIRDVSAILTGGTKGWNWLFVKIQTDDGIVGYGEASLGGKEESTRAAVLELKRYLLGKDPTEIEHHWQAMYRGSFWRAGPVLSSAISGIDLALWDIFGKTLNLPLYKLLGGPCRNKVKAYTHVHGTTPEELGENARMLVKKGFRALKTITTEGENPNSFETREYGPMPRRPIKETAERVAAIRNAVGEGIDLMLDAHGRYDAATAAAMTRELEPYNLLFFEEPVPPEDVSGMRSIRERCRIPIASGERVYSKFGFRQLLVEEALDVLQPDLCHAGGITETKKIASLAESFNTTVAPHNPNSPLSTAVAIQLDASVPNFLVQEMLLDDVAPRNEILKKPLRLEDGYFLLPSGPGLGAEINEEILDKVPYSPMDLPLVNYEDGSITEW